MKKLILGVAVLGLLASCGGDKDGKKADGKTVIETTVTSANAGDLTIGYYNADKLTTDFDFMRETDVKLQAEGRAIEEKLVRWQNIGQQSLAALEKGAQDGTLSVDQQIALDKKMQNAQRNIQQIQQTDYMDLQQRQGELSMVLEKKLLTYSEEFAKANGIKLIFARGGGSGISYIDDAFDITDEFIEYMNAKEKALMGGEESSSDEEK